MVAFSGVALAAVYTLRMYIQTMHNRVGPAVASREISLGHEMVLAPLVVAILALSFYPQVELRRGERSTKSSIRAAASALAERDNATTARVTP
jgi:NADH-quinone oxidoreductase subunit M